MRQLIIYFFVVLLTNTCGQKSGQVQKVLVKQIPKPTVVQTDTQRTIKMEKNRYSEYKIEADIVSYEEFISFINSLSLKKIDGTYVCKKTVGGGHNWHESKDKNGIIYVRGGGTNNEMDFEYIHKK